MVTAISALLQPPIVRTGLLPHTSAPPSAIQKPPSSRDIPPVTLSHIPQVEPSAFRPYLAQVGSLYDAFQRAKQESESGSSHIFRKEKKDEFVELLERGLPKDRQGRSGSISSLTPTESPQPRRRSSGQLSKRNAVTPLSTIPTVYFDENFHLENPRTFDIVSERSEVVRPPQGAQNAEKGANGSLNGAPTTGRKALVTNAILQEKLSWYMDTVEVHLISSISTASTSFFAALGSLRELEHEAADSVNRIQELRSVLAKLDEEMAEGGLKVVGLKRRRDNLRKLADATEQLKCVVDGITHIEDLIESGELETALDRMDLIETIISGTFQDADDQDLSWLGSPLPHNLLDLTQLKALEGVPEGFKQLKYRIGDGFKARFIDTILSDLRQHVERVPPRETLQRWAPTSSRSRGDHSRSQSAFPAYMTTYDGFRRDLLAATRGLSRSDHTTTATTALRDAILREMKAIIRRHLPSSTDDDTESMASTSTRGGRGLTQQDKSSILSRNLRDLDEDRAEELLVNVYTNVGEALRRLSTQVKVLLDVTSGVGTGVKSPSVRSPSLKSPNTPLSANDLNSRLQPIQSGNQLQEELLQALDMSSLLGQAVDAAQSQIVKVLRVRTEITIRLPLQRFLRYFTLNRYFADECEAISGRSGASLKGTVNTHITEFVSKMKESEVQKLAQAMDADTWAAQDFKEAEGAVLTRVLEGMTRDPELWTKGIRVWETYEEETTNDNATQNSNGTATGKKETITASIDEEKFLLVDSAMAVLRGVEKFEILIAVIPSMSTEVSSSLLEYLRVFNSRSYQLILGAGATRSVGLKNINATHLSLASQSLSFLIALMPYIRENVRRHSQSAPLAEYDKVKRLFQDHQQSIHDKLIQIMSSRATAHAKTMREIDFDTASQHSVSPHMEKLTKETTTLYRVLKKHLPEVTVRMIMDPVFENYKGQFWSAFEEAEIETPIGKKRLLKDAEWLHSKLEKIEGAEEIGNHVIDIVNKKEVEGEG